ncbi:uncharacterized protein BX664DRAFT_165302 [Halteromyces radiatus]|uniref:uncharacterized protein n=1 Tax=Halteromyces radiatus TaxID=101107 RepID=UPI00221F2B67|nr:uncharacterized protein BX664DRAFT_165302 [Halteromyces radiatus]KAI8086782.1 hypothetical protein BX664DRAFT_165302 [Halteromyces radiatus]
MVWANINGERMIVVARRNGIIDIIHPDTGAIQKSFQDIEIQQAKTDKPKPNQVRFIGLETTDTHLMTCNSNGTLTWTEWTASTLNIIAHLDKSSTTGGSTIAGPGTDLTIVRAHPIHRHLIAIGGKDIDVQIYDINKFLKKSSKETTKVTTHPRQNKKETKLGLIYQAKNIKNDHLDLPQPVWIRDLQFMNEEGTQVAVATHYHQIRLYDFKKARRPVLNVDVGKLPLATLSVGIDYDHVIFTDTMTDVGMMNIRNGKVMAQLKGFSGATRATQIIPAASFNESSSMNNQTGNGFSLVSAGLDRTLRIHEMNTKYRKLEKKAYLKQQLNCVLVDTEFIVPTPELDLEQQEEEELWNTLDTVQDDKRKKTRLA